VHTVPQEHVDDLVMSNTDWFAFELM
jgi:hypothetical protein